jgi:UTP--glucose-1-phosphate uridylyltransferase
MSNVGDEGAAGIDDQGQGRAAEKMRAAGAHEEAIRSFEDAYTRLRSGGGSLLATADLEPVGDVPAFEDLPEADAAEALGQTALIKLNGGLATSMGLQEPKSLIEVHGGQTFLDVIVGQAKALRARYGVQLPLILMDSDATRAATLAALASMGGVDNDGLQDDFLQSMIPKLDADTLAPAQWPYAPALEWCPPGHGDVYGALRRSGMLEALRDRGIRYAMVSNADNLGAQLDPRIVAHMATHEIPFLMEVVQGTEADRKGGHVARRRADDQLVLRETAQTPAADQESFRDYRRWRYYNTNTLWVDLDVLAERLDSDDGVLSLPLIVNRKTVDPRDPQSTAVIQLESAMGAAIESFPGAALLLVPRTRFAPVKTTDDLLVLRSDVYTISDEMVVAPLPERASDLPYVELDKQYYKLIDDFEQRFPDGPPSLKHAQRLLVSGDVTFLANVTVTGAITLDAPRPERIGPDVVLTGD